MLEPNGKMILNSSRSIVSPIKGTGNMSLDTPVYVTGNFYGNNALTCDAAMTNTKYGGFTSVTFTTLGTVEIWFKTNGWTWNGTTASDGREHSLFAYPDNGAGSGKMLCVFSSGNFVLFDIQTTATQRISTTSITLNATDWYHIAFVWNKDGIGGGAETQQIYLNGIKVANGSNTLSLTSSTYNMPLGHLGITNATIGWNGYISSATCHNYAKTDFADRFNMRSGMNDLILI